MTESPKRPDHDIPADPDEEEGVPAPWPFKLIMTLLPFALLGGLLFADRCSGA